MTSLDYILNLVEQIDGGYRRFFAAASPLDIREHIYIDEREGSSAYAETVLLENAEDLYISVRFSPDLVASSRTHGCPSLSLHQNNLNLFATVAEEVSHFQCIVHAARTGAKVSRFDLELQSEFDKFILASEFLQRQVGHRHLKHLARLLFDSSIVYQDDVVYDRAGTIAAAWWWSQLNEHGEQLFERQDLVRALKELRHVHGQTKVSQLESLLPRRVRRSA